MKREIEREKEIFMCTISLHFVCDEVGKWMLKIK